MAQDRKRRQALRGFARTLGLGDKCVGNGLLESALTHDSYASEGAGRATGAVSNERLEFLGDALLGAIVAEILYRRYPSKSEGMLSRMRAALVSRAALADTARRLGVAPLLRLGRGESAAGGAQRPSILASTVEALVAAMYLSEGLAAAQRFVEHQHVAHAAANETADPKTALQEYTQAKFKKTPHYALTAQSGPAHARTFRVTVTVGSQALGEGEGATKKQAESLAAWAALAALRRDTKASVR